MKNEHLTLTGNPMPLYCLCQDLGFWRLTFAGQQAAFREEQGALYVGYLLVNPPAEPIHPLALCLRMSGLELEGAEIAELVDPATGQVKPVDGPANLRLAEAQTMRVVLHTQNQLEALLEDEEEIEPVKREAERELIALYAYETKHSRQVRQSAQRAGNAVAEAIRRFYEHLAVAVEGNGEPHAVLRAFAAHIKEHLLVPSGRPGGRPSDGLRGCFTYEPPAGIVWTA